MHGPSGNSEETTCPICLQGYEPLDRAVISSCLHAFCIGCLQAWCRKSEARLCPLCKRRIVGYIYAIRSDQDYREHVFGDQLQLQPHEHEQWAVQLVRPAHGIYTSSSSRSTRQHNSRTGQQQQVELDAVHGGVGAHETQTPRMQLRAEPGYTWGDPADWRRDVLQGRTRLNDARAAAGTAGTSSSSTRLRHSSSRWDEGAPGPHGTATGGTVAVAPRPYYWRVQQRMLASVTRQHSSSSTAAGDSNTVLEARRAIYRNNLWAVPHHTAIAHHTAAAAAGVTSSSTCSASNIRVSEAALESWMDRELQALLLEDDVTIICAYVKGLIGSFGVTVPTVQQYQQQQQQQGQQEVSNLQSMRQAAAQAAAAAAFSSDSTVAAAAAGGGNTGTLSSAAAALEGFLFEAAGHFWHELCCYASSGLTVVAWDRVARYVHRDELQQHLPQQQQPHAVVTSCEAGAECVEHAASPIAHHQQQQHGVSGHPLRLDQELSAIRDAAAVAGFLERQQSMQHACIAHQPAAAPAGSDGAAVTAVTPAAAADVIHSSQRPPLVADGRKASSSSGSSNSTEQQQHLHPVGRDTATQSRQCSRRRSRSRSRQGRNSQKHEHAQRSQSSRSSNHLHRDDGSSRQQQGGKRSGGSRHCHADKYHSQAEQHRQCMFGSSLTSRSKSRRDGCGGLARQYRPGSSADLACRSTTAAAAATATHKIEAGVGRWGDDGDPATEATTAPAHESSEVGPSDWHQCQQQQQQGPEWGVVLANDRWQMESMQC